MQSRKELAEAGRRKLEEFRKAKAQGKIATSTTASNPSDDPTPSPPAIINTAVLPPLVNGNGGNYPYGGPALAPAQPPGAGVAATSPNIPSGHAGAALSSAQHYFQTLERPSLAPEVAPKPNSVPTTTVQPPSITSTPVTTFVVLEDAPIPFGAPTTAVVSEGHEASSSGVAPVSSNGNLRSPWGLPMAATTTARSGGDTEAHTQALSLPSGRSDIRPVSNGAVSCAGTESKSLTGTLHVQDGAPGGRKTADGLRGSVNAELSNDVRIFGSPGKNGQHVWPLENTEVPLTSSITAFPVAAAAAAPSPSPLGYRADIRTSPYPFTAGSSAATSQTNFPPALANGLEPRADPVTKGQLDGAHLGARSHAGGAVAGSPWHAAEEEPSSRASTQPDSTSISKTRDALPVQSASAEDAQLTLVPPGANIASSLSYVGVPDMRPSVATSAEVSAGPTSSMDMASAALIRGSGPLTGVALQSGAYSGTSKEAASASDAMLWPRGVAKPAEVEAVNSAAAAGVVSTVTCYDQLSDSYLGTNNATPASGAPDARASLGEGPPVLSERLGDAALGGSLGETSSSAAAAVPATPSTSSAVPDRSADNGINSLAGLASIVAGDIMAVQPPEFSVTSSSASRLLEPPGLPPPRAAPAPSRFAWLFGSPPPVKQTAPLEQPVIAAPQTQTPVLPPAAVPPQALPWEAASQMPGPPAVELYSTSSFTLDQASPVAEDLSLLSSLTRADMDARNSASASSTYTLPDAGAKHAPSRDNASGNTTMPVHHLQNFAGHHTDPGADAYVPHQLAFSSGVYGIVTNRVGVAGGTTERGVAGAPLPSFLRDIDTTTAMQSGREERSVPPTVVPVPPGDSSSTPKEMASGAGAAVAEDFMTAPSFSTSFPPLPSTSPLPQPHATSWPPPAVPAPASAVTSVSTPHFATATSYLSAYSSAAGAAPHGGLAAVTTMATSSFLESYLDNLLSTISTAPKDGVEDPHSQSQTGGRNGSSNGTHPDLHGGVDQSNEDTSRHSKMGDAPGDTGTTPLGPHATANLASEGPEAPPGRNGSMDDQFLGTRESGDAEAALGDASSSGRAMALPHMNGVVHQRGHHSRGVLHAGPASAYGPGVGNSGVSRAQFAALQQHIDELTEEKLALARGLQQQTRINEQLAEENEELMRQYNTRGSAMEELQRKVKQYEQELEAQTLSLEGFSEERHAARSSYAEAASRAQALAAEVVGLEAQVLQLKSAVLKAERTAEEAQQRVKKLEKQVATLTREAQERAQELHQTQLKGRNLVVKLKQTEAKLEAAEGKLAMQIALAGTTAQHGSVMPNGHHPAPPPQLLPKPTAEQEVQCDLATELEEASRAAMRSDSGANGPNGDAAAATTFDGSQERAADGASISSGAAQDGTDGGPLALARQPSAAVSTEISDVPDRLVRVDWDAARPPRDAPSAVVAERALASMDSRELRAAARGALPEGLGAVALQLARWLPAGPVSGGDPVAVMVEEELRLMESIHELLGSFEQAQEATMGQIAELRAHISSLTSENDELRKKLELQTQRLELQMQGMATTMHPVSLHQTPAAVSPPEEGSTGVIAMTPSSAPQSYQPARPFLPVHADHEAAVITPSRSIRMTPSMESPVAGGLPLKHTWMGYLFRPRQKKRTRSPFL